MARTAFVGVYTEHETGIQVRIRRTTTQQRIYTHAVIPYATSRIKYVPSPEHDGLTIPVSIPCDPRHGKAQFCSSLALAQRKLKPGYLLVEVHEELR